MSFIATDECGYVLARSDDRAKALTIAIKDAGAARRAGVRVTIVAQDSKGSEKLAWRDRA
jgi:hypothetical protein